MYQRRLLCRGGENECKTTLFITRTSSNLLTCINVFCVLHIYCQVTCSRKKRADREEKLIEVEDVWYVLAM